MIAQPASAAHLVPRLSSYLPIKHAAHDKERWQETLLCPDHAQFKD